MYDVIIVGGGPSGLSSALYAKRGGLKTLLIERMVFGGQMNLTGEIENYLGFLSISGYELGENMRKACEAIGVEFLFDEVTSLNLKDEIKQVKCSSETLEAKTIVLAMGARARDLGIDEEKTFIGKGLSYCAHCDGNFFRKKDVVVVGGGNTALTDALYLSNIANSVALVHRRDEFRGNKILVERLKQKNNVTFLLNKVVQKIIGEDKISALTLKDKITQEESELSCQGLFVAVGTSPNSELAKGVLEMDKHSFLVVDENMQTSQDKVYAVGDLRQKPLRQVVTAVSDGAIASNHILTLLA